MKICYCFYYTNYYFTQTKNIEQYHLIFCYLFTYTISSKTTLNFSPLLYVFFFEAKYNFICDNDSIYACGEFSYMVFCFNVSWSRTHWYKRECSGEDINTNARPTPITFPHLIPSSSLALEFSRRNCIWLELFLLRLHKLMKYECIGEIFTFFEKLFRILLLIA